MNAMLETFHVDPTGCQFHLKQAWERKFRKYGMDTRRKDIPRTFLEFIDVLNGAIYLNVNWEWTKYFLDMYMNNIRMHVESEHSNFPPALLEPFRKCFDYLKKNYFTEGGKYFVGKFANYSRSIADSHFVCTNNTNESVNSALNKKLGAIYSKKRLAEELADFYEDRRDRLEEFLAEEKDGIRSKELLKKYAEQKHIHEKYFRYMNGFISWRNMDPANADHHLYIGYEMFFVTWEKFCEGVRRFLASRKPRILSICQH